MDRDISTPFSSLLLSSQVFRSVHPSGYSSRVDGGHVINGTKDNIFYVPQSRTANVALQQKVSRGINVNSVADDERFYLLQGSSRVSKQSDHSVKINRTMKIPDRKDASIENGNNFFVSEGNYNSFYWSPLAAPDQVSGKLLVPNFYTMKATCGQRSSQLQSSVSPPNRCNLSTNHTDGYRFQSNFSQILQNGQVISTAFVNEVLESGHYDNLKNVSSRTHNIQREKCISVTYKEHPKMEKHTVLSTHRSLVSESTCKAVGDVESQLRLSDLMDRYVSRPKKLVAPTREAEDAYETEKQNAKTSHKIASAITEEGSEEFVSRAPSVDDDASVRGAWDGDDETVDDEDDIGDGEDDLVDNDDNDEEDDDDDDGSNRAEVSRASRVTSAAPGFDTSAEAETTATSSQFGAVKKQFCPAPLSRVRQAHQEQQRRLRDTMGIDKGRPGTGCAVVFNGSAAQGAVLQPSTQRNRVAGVLPKRSVTRPPTANAPAHGDNRPINGELAPFHKRESHKVGETKPGCQTLQALHPSLFSNFPPTLVFAGEDQTVVQLPRELRNLLRWRTSTITPNILKKILARSNFKLTAKDEIWVGCWAKHMKQDMFKAIREFQKFNHFPASFQIGRKDRLWRNLSAMQARYGRKEFSFFPQTYVLPGDYKLLKRVMEESDKRQRWILKPPASARGNGIRCVCSLKQIPKKRPVIVQKYIHQPYLINESKFDIRLYVYVASYDPLKAYIYTDGLARFASTKYSTSLRDLPNKFMHLTNYSINKHNSEYQSNGDLDAQVGHKWSLHALWEHLSSPLSEEEAAINGITSRKPADIDSLWAQIKDIAVKTIIAAEQHIVSAVKMNVANRYCVHELFGFDILLDRDLHPWLLEVNISPSLHSDSSLDMKVKGEMLKDLLNLAGYKLPDSSMIRTSDGVPEGSENTSATSNASRKSVHFDPRLVSSQLSADERNKHSFFTQNYRNDQVMKQILDTLTPDDIRILTEFEDERSRIGSFEPLFPTTQSKNYLKMMETPRYYNLLLDAWLKSYGDDVDSDGNPINRHEKGLELLDSFCRRGLHLENPTNDWRHIWRPPANQGMVAPVYRSNGGSAIVASQLSPSRTNNLHPSHSTGSLPNDS